MRPTRKGFKQFVMEQNPRKRIKHGMYEEGGWCGCAVGDYFDSLGDRSQASAPIQGNHAGLRGGKMLGETDLYEILDKPYTCNIELNTYCKLQKLLTGKHPSLSIPKKEQVKS